VSRFVVSSVTGYANNPRSSGAPSGGQRGLGPSSVYYVNDTVFNCRVLAEYRPMYGLTRLLCRKRAERYCDQLNAWAAGQ
jgi:hypothetical protein